METPRKPLEAPLAMAVEGTDRGESRMVGKGISEIAVGETAEITRTVTESDVVVYAGVTGDTNPLHLNETYAQGTIFKTRIAHGMLLAGYISAMLGNIFPGPGTIYLKQELQFLAPVPIGDTVTIRVEVTALDVQKNRLTLRTTCINQNGVTVLDGLARVIPPEEVNSAE